MIIFVIVICFVLARNLINFITLFIRFQSLMPTANRTHPNIAAHWDASFNVCNCAELVKKCLHPIKLLRTWVSLLYNAAK